MNELVFDNDSKILERVFLFSEYLYKSYFPPIQVVFFGENNNIVYADSSVNILNESTSPKFEKFYTKKIPYIVKIKMCVFSGWWKYAKV